MAAKKETYKSQDKLSNNFYIQVRGASKGEIYTKGNGVKAEHVKQHNNKGGKIRKR